MERLRFNGNGNFYLKDRVLSAQVCRIGYETIKISTGSSCKRMKVHRLIAFAFVANDLNKSEVNHIDCNKLNNKPCNLEWVTRKENMQHAGKSGVLGIKGSLNTQSKLIDSDVIKIKQFFLTKASNIEISKFFNIHPSTIYKIRKGISWKHVFI